MQYVIEVFPDHTRLLFYVDKLVKSDKMFNNFERSR